MVLIAFRSRLTEAAGADYAAAEQGLEALARQAPGFVDVRSYVAEDGERLTLVWWRDAESLKAWRQLPRHVEAQQAGRARWYEFYRVEVAEVIRESAFARESPGRC